MGVTVLGIAGSPRRQGNTDALLEQVMAGAASRGAETRTVVLSDLTIAPCRHCDGCIGTGRCIIEDDMQKVHIDLQQVERLVIASPVFFMGPTAQTKAMIDRCQALWALKYLLKKPISLIPKEKRRALFVAVGGTKLKDTFSPSLTIVKTWLRVLDFGYAGELTYPGIDEAGAIKQHPTALQEAFAAGQKLAE
jgi:multimeric flavodoxin WrbA